MEKPTPLGIKLKAQKAKVRQGKASLEEEWMSEPECDPSTTSAQSAPNCST